MIDVAERFKEQIRKTRQEIAGLDGYHHSAEIAQLENQILLMQAALMHMGVDVDKDDGDDESSDDDLKD